MNNKRQTTAILGAAKYLNSQLKSKFGNHLKYTKLEISDYTTECVARNVNVASFKLTDAANLVVNQEIEIDFQLEMRLDKSFVLACYFWGNYTTLNTLLSYFPYKQAPADSADEYSDGTGFYKDDFAERVLHSKNHCVFELDKADDWGSLGFYGNLNDDTYLSESYKFVESVILALPGFEALAYPVETTREQIILARVGQGKYRDGLMEKWGKKCSVLGIAVQELLRASHIKPWRLSDSDQRLDPENGLLLSAHIDALFDKHLISFENDGTMLIGSKVAEALAGRKDFIGKIDEKKITAKMRGYLAFHRKEYEIKQKTT